MGKEFHNSDCLGALVVVVICHLRGTVGEE